MKRRTQGFTLLELLAATALFAVLGTMLFQIVRGALDVWALGERNREMHDRSAPVLELLAEDLRRVWPGQSSGEQAARLLCTLREETEAGDSETRVPLLRFVRLARTDPSAPPSDGLVETLVTMARPKGQALHVLVRRDRPGLGGEGSLLEAELPFSSEQLLSGAQTLATGVLWFGAEFWSQGTERWEAQSPGDAGAALSAWDSTRGLLPPEDPAFPLGLGAASLSAGHDDILPRLVRLTLVLDDTERGQAGALANALTPQSTRVELASAGVLQRAELPDHVLIDQEWMAVQSVEGRSLVVQRGRRGSRAVPHDEGAPVRIGQSFERVVALPTAREHWSSNP
ncbi:MAG: prepilin-type N-terminal cleavage/methylation domain-containing protein [Planctomycetota bacterium]